MDRDRSVPKLLSNSRLILQQDNLRVGRFGKKASADVFATKYSEKSHAEKEHENEN
jgi:hypothetical protein